MAACGRRRRRPAGGRFSGRSRSAGPGRADREAACRPLPNAGVTMDDIPEPHLEATVERRRPEPVILAVQDTTKLNCGTLAATSGPDGPGGGGKGTDGIPAHCGVAPGGTGRPQGARRHADAALR